MDNGSYLATTLPGSTALPFVISTEAYRISYFALLATATCADLLKESRMQILKTTGLDRKSGERSAEICGSFRLTHAVTYRSNLRKGTPGSKNVTASV
jgi:hypothetical protein